MGGTVAPAAMGAATAQAVQAPAPADGVRSATSLRVGTYNLYNLFDTVDNPRTRDMVLTPDQYDVKLTKLSVAIRDALGGADVIALQEVENEQVLADLVAQPALKELGYKPVFRDGNDGRGINVAMLHRDTVQVTNVEQYNPAADLPDKARGQLDATRLYSRPPLAVDFRLTGATQAAEGAAHVTVVANHLKSKLGGPAQEPRRVAQAAQLGTWIDQRREAEPDVPIILTGDFNTLPDDPGYKPLTQRADGSQRIDDTVTSLPAGEQYTYIYRGQKNLLDHMFTTPDLADAHTGTSIPRISTPKDAKKHAGDPTTPLGASDHDPIIADFELGALLKQQASGQPLGAAS